jgi:repressor LexA
VSIRRVIFSSVFISGEQMTFGERLRAARKAAGLNQTLLGKAVGMSQGAIAHIETGYRGVEQSPEIVAKLETALGLPTGELARHLPATHPARQMAAVVIPVKGVVAAGAARDEPCDDDDRLKVSEHFADCVAYKVRGDSMRDIAILDGDYIMVRPSAQQQPKVGDTVVAWLSSGSGGHVVKSLTSETALQSSAGGRWKHNLREGDVILGVYRGLIRPPSESRAKPATKPKLKG